MESLTSTDGRAAISMPIQLFFTGYLWDKGEVMNRAKSIAHVPYMVLVGPDGLEPPTYSV